MLPRNSNAPGRLDNGSPQTIQFPRDGLRHNPPRVITDAERSIVRLLARHAAERWLLAAGTVRLENAA